MTTRDRLIQSAQELLWERGFVGMSPKTIQARSGAGQGSMYHHFKGKADLAAAAIEEQATVTKNVAGEIAQATSVVHEVNDQVAQNGLMQNQVDTTQTGLKSRQDALTTTLGDLTNVDQAAAATKLQLAQTALQASAQVFSSLQGTSLLNTLSPGG